MWVHEIIPRVLTDEGTIIAPVKENTAPFLQVILLPCPNAEGIEQKSRWKSRPGSLPPGRVSLAVGEVTLKLDITCNSKLE